MSRSFSTVRSVFVVLAALLSAEASAQVGGSNDYGSIYSRYGLGERAGFSSSQAAMLGRTGVSMRTGIYNDLGNPALWSDQTVTTFTVSGGVTGTRSIDDLNTEASRATAGDLFGIQFGVPILPGRLGATVSYRPYSRTNYRSAIADSIEVEGTSVDYQLNQEGAGGLQEIGGGLGLRIGDAIQVGASASAIFGSTEYLERTTFDDPGFVETRRALGTQYRGVTATLGAAATLRGLTNENDGLTFGAALTLPTRLDASRTLTVGNSLDRDTLASSIDGEATLPLAARAGVAFRSGGRWLVTAEGLYEPWSQFETTLPVGGFDASRGVNELQDRLRVGGGFQFVPSLSRNARLFQRSAYRLGGYAEQALYAPTGSSVSTLALTGGISLPTRLTGARFDLGFELGTRGSTDGVLVRDTFLKGSATINFGERWFVRRRLD
ncbi:MAG: hypothetical protein AAF170_02360 [Bacteroidota bacterium]